MQEDSSGAIQAALNGNLARQEVYGELGKELAAEAIQGAMAGNAARAEVAGVQDDAVKNLQVLGVKMRLKWG